MTERASAWLRARLLDRRDAAGLAAFRCLFGLLGLISALRFLHYGWVDELFVRPRFFFSYGFAPFVEPLDSTGMHALFWVLAVSAACVAVGLLYRVAIVTFFLGISYVQLVDVTNYLNHYYLVSLLALLMSFMPLSRAYSLDALLFPARASATLPGWCTALLRLQVAVVYVFAGLAKVTEDWLVHAQPLDIWLSSRSGLPIIGPALALPWMPYAMSWGGCLFDLTIVGWLSWRRSRPYAFALVLFFHALTKALFPIGMFPAIMIVAATVFFAESWPRRFMRGTARTAIPRAQRADRPSAWTKLGLATAGVFAVVQILVPLRAHLYGGNVHWHEQGMRFSWRVMVREKNASVTYLVENPRTGRVFEVSPRRYLDNRQEREFGAQPDLVQQLAKQIARDYAVREGGPVHVRADVIASLNGRRSARLIDPQVDLAAVADGLDSRPWILPAPASKPPYLHAPRWKNARSEAQR